MTLLVPDTPDAMLTRRHAAAALTAAGYPVAPATLATRASRGGGPPYQRFGRVPLYRWGDCLDWAHSRLSAPVRSTSEADAVDGRGSTSETIRRAQRR
jgi:hypothetical protein